MICAEAAAQAVIDGRLPGGSGIRVVPLTTDYDPPLQLLAGIFARKGERELYDAAHPLNLLWNAFDAYVRDSRGVPTGRHSQRQGPESYAPGS